MQSMSAHEDTLAAGLSDDEARARLARDGPNRLPLAPRRGPGRIALSVATQPMILLLLATTLAYAALGSATDAIGLLVSVLLIGVIAVYQQQRIERVLASLRELSSPRARVLRSGRVQRIASQDLVRGDLLLLAEGDRLACDAVILRCHSLLLDESLLSGESAPVLKRAAHGAAQEASDDERVRAGTLVVQGDGAALVDATGAATALGRIGSSLAQIVPRASRVQAELKRVVSGVAVAAVVICLAAVLALQFGVRAADWSDDWSRAAALGSVIATNLAMLVWFRTGAQTLRQHAGNRAFAWLLAGLAAACGVVLSLAPLTRPFGLPVEPAVQTAGWLLMAAAAVAALALGWRRRRP